MPIIAFDTLKYAKRLKDSGVPDKQAEAEAEALAEVLEVNLKDLPTKEDLRRDLRELEQRMIIKLGGMMMAAIAIVATLVKLL